MKNNWTEHCISARLAVASADQICSPFSSIKKTARMLKEKDWFDIALEHQDEQNYSQALFAVEKYITQNPNNKRGKLLKAVICRDLANFDLSLRVLSVIQPSENDSEVYSKLYYREVADTYCEMGNYEEALKWYGKMIEIVPDETVGYISKGSCLARAGKYELAKIEHLKATELKGDPEEAFYNLALISRAEMNFEAAKDYCEKSLKIDPNDRSVIHCYEDILEAIKLGENQ